MNKELFVPQLDNASIQEKVNEYAFKGAVESIKEFYSGYNSPYKKAIEEELKKKPIDRMFDLPDILAVINDSLSKQIDIIANQAIARTYIPMVNSFLTRVNKELNFSTILTEFVEITEQKDIEDCEVSVERDTGYGWLTITIGGKDKEYQFTLHEEYNSKKGPLQKYQLLGLPRDYSKGASEKMKIMIDKAVVEIPFTRDILLDKFTSYLARIIICDCEITMDTKEFDYSMFPERCHC